MRKTGFLQQFAAVFRDLPRDLSVALSLARRDLLAEIRVSKLGLLWPLVYPIAYTAFFLLLRPAFSAGADALSAKTVLFVFVGFSLWQVWFESLNQQLEALRRNWILVSRAQLSGAAIFFSGVMLALYHTAVRLAVVCIVALILLPVAPLDLLAFVLFAVVVPINGAVFGLLLQPIATLQRDVVRVVQSLSLALLVSGAVFFALPANLSETIRSILALNPLASLLDESRSHLLGTVPLFPREALLWIAVTLLVMPLQLVAHKRMLPVLVERLGN